MSEAAAPPADGRSVPAREVARIAGRHLLVFWFPALAFAFLATGPHPWWRSLLFFAPIVVAYRLDVRSRDELRQPAPTLPEWPFDGILLAVSALLFANIALLVRRFADVPLLSMDVFVGSIVVGVGSAIGIVVAHEWIHRREGWMQTLGRALLVTVLYEHFYTEHIRGHHVRVGTPEDPATARFGERFGAFYRRTVPGQFKSAWRLETTRLGDPDMRLLDPRNLGNRVLHGVVAQAILSAVVLAYGGLTAFVVFVLQGSVASRLLEVVNYFEHWGLMRTEKKVRPIDSWDTNAWFTYYGLTGLTRHADHHAYPSRPFQQLRVWEEPPRLPLGYVGMVVFVLVRNERFIKVMTRELERRGLGPFAKEARAA